MRLWSLDPAQLDRAALVSGWRTRLAGEPDPALRMTVTDGQLDLEWRHLLAKCDQRSPDRAAGMRASAPRPHPIFDVVSGPVADWERAAP